MQRAHHVVAPHDLPLASPSPAPVLLAIDASPASAYRDGVTASLLAPVRAAAEYAVDLWQRSWLYVDAMRERIAGWRHPRSSEKVALSGGCTHVKDRALAAAQWEGIRGFGRKRRTRRISGPIQSAFAALLLSSAMAAAAEDRAAAAKLPALAPGERILGAEDAPVTIIEYASLTCGHCAEFEVKKMPKIRQDWIETARAKLAFRHFPLDRLALRAAALTHCVPAERYFDFMDLLYKEQANWVHLPDTDEALRRVARYGGLIDAEKDSCLADIKLLDLIVADRQIATKEYGVDSIPTFFINGTRIEGDVPYEEFESALTAAFAKR